MSIASRYTLKVELASSGGPLTASPTWTDATTKVRAADVIKATRGRQSEQSSTSPGSASFTLSGWAGDAPAAMIGRRVRVTTTLDAVAYSLWAGHITDWSDTWDGAGVRVSQVSAVGILEVLARDESPGLFYATLAALEPLSWWPLDDPTGTTARDIRGQSPLTVAQAAGASGAWDFQAGPVFDENPWAAATPVSAVNGKSLWGQLRGLRADQDFTVAIVNRGDGTAASRWDDVVLLRNEAAVGPYVGSYFSIRRDAVPAVYPWQLLFNGTGGSSAGTADLSNPHLLVATWSASTHTATLWVDGYVEVTDALGPAYPPTGYWEFISIGSRTGVAPAGNYAHLAVWQRVLSSAEITGLATAAVHAKGFGITMPATNRWHAIGASAGVPDTMRVVYGTDAASMPAQPIKGVTTADALGAVEYAEQGILAETATGQVALWCNDQRDLLTPAVTLDARTEVLNDFRLRTNTSGLVNDYTITSGATGAQYQAANTDSVTANGRRSQSGTAWLAADSDVQALGAYLAYRDSNPSPRSDQIVVDMETLAARSKAAGILGLEPGDTLALAYLPDGVTRLLEVQGFDDEVGPAQWRRTIRVAPSRAESWVLDSPTLSVLGTTTVPQYGLPRPSAELALLRGAVFYIDAEMT